MAYFGKGEEEGARGFTLPSQDLGILGRAQKSRFWVFLQLAKRLCPLELYRHSVQGGAVGSKSYLMVVETHDAAMIRTLTSSVAAMYLAAGAVSP